MESILQIVERPVADDGKLRLDRSGASLVALQAFDGEVDHLDCFHKYMAVEVFFVVVDVEVVDGVDENVAVVVVVVVAVFVAVAAVVELMANRALNLVVLAVNREELDSCDELMAYLLSWLTSHYY
jgi:hypothetical protein